MTLSCVMWGMDGGGGRSCCSPLGWNHPNRGIPCGIKAGEGLMEGWEPAAGRERGEHRKTRRNVSSNSPSLLKGIDFCTYVYAKSHHNVCTLKGHSSGCQADRDQREALSAELHRQGVSTTQPRPLLTSETQISSPEILNTSWIQTQVL